LAAKHQNRVTAMRIRYAIGFLAFWLSSILPTAMSLQPSFQPVNASFRVLYGFRGGTDGSMPDGGVIRDQNGNLYGTTRFGGDLACNAYLLPGCGVIFKLDPSGHETVLYRFAGPPADGRNPNSALLRDRAGNFYGTTFGGGAHTYYGTIFELNRSGKETVLYSFTGGADGNGPASGLTMDGAGDLYGIASYGGDLSCTYDEGEIPGCGVIFKLDRAHKLTVLHTFSGGSDGAGPETNLILAVDGMLYGTTAWGPGDGCLFKIDPNGQKSILYRFPNSGIDGALPEGNILANSSGVIYGETSYGGTPPDGFGVVFKIDDAGRETVLHNFDLKDSYPNSLIEDSEHSLYGTAAAYQFNNGTVFRIANNGAYAVLYRFTGGSDGLFPVSLMQYNSNTLIGVTQSGGDANGDGVVFEVRTPHP
jgi:uncharacterized repeat protein (TIGR03803 family)